jgi:hypothetical protein
LLLGGLVGLFRHLFQFSLGRAVSFVYHDDDDNVDIVGWMEGGDELR